MPYSIPAPMPAPLPVHSKGRAGHRRSFSYDEESSNNNFRGDFSQSGPSTSSAGGAFASLGALPRRKPASFHIEADDDDDSSPEEGGNSSPQENLKPKSSPTSSPTSSSSNLVTVHLKRTPQGKPAHVPSDDDRDDDDAARGLPPLKLKIPSFSNYAAPGASIPRHGSPIPTNLNVPPRGSPTLANAGSSGIPFPRTSSPPRSRTSSADNLVRLKSPSPVPEGDAAPHSADPSRPNFPRTASTPILLSNGKPLKSSLKSSTSSPNIPFPAQSLVPSRIYAEIAQQQAMENAQNGFTVPANQRHIRAASAPAMPNLNSSGSSPSDSVSPTPDSQTAPTTPSAPKAVHFPSSEEGGLATIKIFKRSAKPVSLSVPGASGGEETETETDGEGYNSGGGASSGWAYQSGWGGWGSGYNNPWDRYRSQNANHQAQTQQGKGPQGYPFPRIAKDHPQAKPSPLSKSTNSVEKEEKKRIVYELDLDTTSTVPKRDLSMFDNVFLESIKLSSATPSSSNNSDSSSSSEDDESPSVPKYSDKMQTTLDGTLLVRNLSYEKFLSVRFTLDDWHTTSEVKALYKESLDKLPKKWMRAVRGDRSPSDDDEPSSTPSNPQWDRFGFSINLSDYARSRSLSSRTLWLVIRYNVPGPVRYPVAAPFMHPILPSSMNPHSSTDILYRSDPEMLTLIANGLGGTSDSHTQGRLVMESEMRKANIAVEGATGNEWWDNNANGNYKIGFREREIVVVRQSKEVEETVDPVAQQAQAQSQAKRRSAISCPPAFTNAPPPPPSITSLPHSHSSLSPPQISTSTSLDSYQPIQAWPDRAPETNNAKAETTLERLKRLNLRNYAAPGTGTIRTPSAVPPGRVLAVPPPVPVTTKQIPPQGEYRLRAPESNGAVRHDSTSSMSSLSSSSSLSSGTNSETSTNDSTPLTSPLHTPTLSHIDIVFPGEEKTDRSWYSEEKKDDTKTGDVDGASTPTQVPNGMLSPLLSPFAGPDMGTSPPFSTLGSLSVSKLPNSASLPSSGMDTPKASNIVREEADTPTPAASTPVPTLPRGPASLILEDIREKSTSSPPRSPSGSGRNSPVERGAGAVGRPSKLQQEERKEVKKASPNASASGSDSGSGSSTRRRHGHGHRSAHSHSGAGSNGRGSLGLLFGSGTSSPSGVRSPSQNYASPLSSSSHSSSQSSLRSPLDEIRDPDSIYQAFVKQWCFAQEPAPAGAGYGGMSGGKAM